MAVAWAVPIYRFDQTLGGFERFFASKVPHEYLARFRRWSGRLRRK